MSLMADQINQMLREADARGYERGVREAVAAGDARSPKGYVHWWTVRPLILALLEPTLQEPEA